MSTSPQESTCPLCGLVFVKSDALCHHGCPLAATCDLTQCPGCGYEFPDRPMGYGTQPGGRGKLERLFDIVRRRRPQRLGPTTPSVCDLETGARAKVLQLAGDRARDALAVFGLVPGADFELVQRSPAFVLRVGETELALDAEVAGRILVEPAA